MSKPLVFVVLASLVCVSPIAADPHLPEPAALRDQVDFWTRVYVEIGTNAGFLHDNRFLGVVYETVPAAEGARGRDAVDARRAYWRRMLLELGEPPTRSPEGAHPDLRAVAARWEAALGRPATPAEYRAASQRLRFQRGQRDKFEQGLVRSGRYESEIRRVLAGQGVPPDLAYLPHVESSFDSRAYSKHGAAGMWQFMPATARRYLRVDGIVDERLDPEPATRAAARLLRSNYARLGTWPLAITAYNHGTEGVRRARDRLGTTDIAAIIAEYAGPRFGFASRNFYPQFLAARRVAREERRYFGEVIKATPVPLTRVRLPFYLDFAHAVRAFEVPRAELRALNPSLRAPVLRSEKYIPKDFVLTLPGGRREPDAHRRLERIALAERHPTQRPQLTHTVRRGETLGHIAARHGLGVRRLAALNGIDERALIFPGQRLELGAAPPAPATRAAAPGGSDGPGASARAESVTDAWEPEGSGADAIREAPVPPRSSESQGGDARGS